MIALETASGKQWPFIVVGAGMAGTALSTLLVSIGHQVLLLDKNCFPRHKTCGGCLNAQAVALLHEFGLGGVLESLQPHRLERILFRLPNKAAEVPLSRSHYSPVSVTRYVLDKALLDEAIKKGVTFIPGVTVTGSSIAGETRMVTARAENGESVEFHAEGVIACDGLGGRLASTAGLTRESPAGLRPKIGTSLVCPREMFPNLPSHTITMLCGRSGYLGLAQAEGGKVNMAAAFIPEARPRDEIPDMLRRFGMSEAAAAMERRELLSGISTCPRLQRAVSRPVEERLALVGDAAGYVEPITGEGMAWALAGAGAAARAFARGWSEGAAAVYESNWRRTVANRRSMARALSRVMDSSFATNASVSAVQRFPAIGKAVAGRISATNPSSIGIT